MKAAAAWVRRTGLGLAFSISFLIPASQLMERPGIALWERLAALGCAIVGIIIAFYFGRISRAP